MPDKQIIVDGVDVSKCNYFSFTDEYYCDECSSEFGCATCDERPNCCYKQLKRKEQTLKEIKEIVEDFAKQDILTFPDLKPKENYKLIQKQCGELIIKILQKIMR